MLALFLMNTVTTIYHKLITDIAKQVAKAATRKVRVYYGGLHERTWYSNTDEVTTNSVVHVQSVSSETTVCTVNVHNYMLQLVGASEYK